MQDDQGISRRQSFYNTATRTRQTFVPLRNRHVGCYVCGPTVYAGPHLGHARSAVFYDVVRRYLRSTGYSVTYVRNITDIDDKIIAEAKQCGQDFRSVASENLTLYNNTMATLGADPPDYAPRVSDYLDRIQSCIARLIQKQHAYATKGGVYFASDTCKDYGRLSGRKCAPPACGATRPETGKRGPRDFVLWKAAKTGEPSWPSPWGDGRPGWHIECTAMSSSILDPCFDIHGGGKDLIFPHHENELAQSQCLFGSPPARYWLHHDMVTAKGDKISKSSSGYMPLTSLLEQYPPHAVRFFLLSRHYRRPLDFSHGAMLEAMSGLSRIIRFFKRMEDHCPDLRHPAPRSRQRTLWQRFCYTMDDDFNTAGALQLIFQTIRKYATSGRPAPPSPDARADLTDICRGILGIVPHSIVDYQRRCRESLIRVRDTVERLIASRLQARRTRTWDEADRIYRTLKGLDITLQDTSNQTTYKMGKFTGTVRE